MYFARKEVNKRKKREAIATLIVLKKLKKFVN